jgi:flagellar basal-body rod modification protein FlgD
MSPTTPAATAAASASAASAASGANGVTTDEFLQLLVAEIQNQDPTAPMDGTTFLTQLAEFQQVEQGVTLNQDVSGILTDTNTLAGADSATATNPT